MKATKIHIGIEKLPKPQRDPKKDKASLLKLKKVIAEMKSLELEEENCESISGQAETSFDKTRTMALS